MKKLNKKQKKNLLIGIVLILLVVFFINLQTLSLLGSSSATLYNSFSVNSQELKMTYKDVSGMDLRANSLKEIHALNGLDDTTRQYDAMRNFGSPPDNKEFLNFYLEINDIDSSLFIKNNYLARSVFTLKNWKDYATLLGDESDSAYKYVLRDASNTPYYDKIKSLGFSWDYRGFYVGGVYNLNQIANKLNTCYVEGTIDALAEDYYLKPDRMETGYNINYKIYGKTEVRGSLVCKLDSSELNEFMEQLPKNFTRPDGGIITIVNGARISNGLVVFGTQEIIDPVTYYRFLDNQCSSISILPSQKTSNDYSTLSECQDNLIDTNLNQESESTTKSTNKIIYSLISLIALTLLTMIYLKTKNKFSHRNN